MKQRVIINISGQVQGVNLRSMIKLRAIALGIVGYVQNQGDRTVKIEAEGETKNLEELITWLNTHPGVAQIEKLEDYWSKPENKFTDFAIRW